MSDEQTKDVQKMTTEALARFSESVLEVWKSPEAIRKIFCPDLTDEEFKFFMGMGLSLQANPFKKEIFPVKYGGKPVSIIVARALYKRRAQEQPDYGGCVIEAVYPGEEFKPNPFDPLKTIHTIDTEKRYGKDKPVPYGAYFIGVYKEGKIPLYHFVATKEYFQWVRDQKTGQMRLTKFWSESPETMIKKVVDSQGHRLMYEGIFSGTVTEDEVAANADKFEDAETESKGEDVMSSLDETIKGRTPVEQTKKQEPTKEHPPTPESPPDKEAEKLTSAQMEKETEEGSIGKDEPVGQYVHEWPEWAAYPREHVQRKFKYFKNELFPKHKEELKKHDVFNTMQVAMLKFDANDFVPAEISPAQYDEAVVFVKGIGPGAVA